MKAKVLVLTAVFVSFITLASASWAHHASRQVYEGKSITLMGVVTDYEWANPHSVLSVAIKDDTGKVEEWHAEILPSKEMLRAGWAKERLKGGGEGTLGGGPRKYAQHIVVVAERCGATGSKTRGKT